MLMQSGTIINNDYQINSLLGEGSMGYVYSATNVVNGNKVAVKVIKNSNISLDIAIHFRKELSIIQKMDHPGIIKLLEFGVYKNQNFFITPIIHGEPLNSYLKKALFTADQALSFISELAQALGHAHIRGIVHRDIKPANIMLTTHDQISKPVLLDFGLSTINDLALASNNQNISGTFLYMAPESIGILPRAIDSRSDLYSLGIVFYELVTGTVPFKGTISEICHQHVAIIPTPPSVIKPELKHFFDIIILKLLAKEPADRYQSTAELINEIKKFSSDSNEIKITRQVDKITLRSHTEFHGHQEELDQLLTIFNQLSANGGEVCVMLGETGIGKTRLALEFKNRIRNSGSLFFSGDCINSQKRNPYQPFKDIVNEFLKWFRLLPDEQKKCEKKRLQSIFGSSNDLLTHLNPFLCEIFDNTIPHNSSIPDKFKEDKLFKNSAARFFLNFTQPDTSTVLFIDNFQWADDTTIEILNEILFLIKNSNLLIICAIRDRDENTFLSTSIKDLIHYHTLKKVPLKAILPEASLDIITDLTGEEKDSLRSINDHIYLRSKGNPFLLVSILRELSNQQAFYMIDNKWFIDQKAMNSIELSSNIIDLIIKNINKLTPEEKSILAAASVAGNTFCINLLYNILDEEKNLICNTIDHAVQLQLIGYDEASKHYYFIHDTVEKHCYNSLTDQKKKEYHLKLAILYEKKGSEGSLIYKVFHHYSQTEIKDRAIRAALKAAQFAENEYAYKDALFYLESALLYFDENDVFEGVLVSDIHFQIGNLYISIGKYDKAIAILTPNIEIFSSDIDKASLLHTIGICQLKKADFAVAIEYFSLSLKTLGIIIPSKKSTRMITALFHLIYSVTFLPILSLLPKDKRVEKQKRSQKIIQIFEDLFNCAVFSDYFMCFYVGLRQHTYARKHLKTCSELGISYCLSAMLLAALGLYKRSILTLQKAAVIFHSLHDTYGSAVANRWLGFTYCLTGKPYEAIKYCQKALDSFSKMNDLWEMEHVLNALNIVYFMCGEPNKRQKVIESYQEISKILNDKYGICNTMLSHFGNYIMMGEYDLARKHGQWALSYSIKHNLWSPQCMSRVNLGITELEDGNIQKAIDIFEEVFKLERNNKITRPFISFLYCFLTDAYVERFKSNYLSYNSSEKKTELKKIRTTIKTAIFENIKAPNFFGLALRCLAKYFSITDRFFIANWFFRRSITHLSKLSRKYELAKTYFEYGIFLAHKNKTLAVNQWKTAEHLFTEISSKVYLKKVKKLLAQHFIEAEKPQTVISDRIQLTSMLNVTRLLSSILELDNLLEKILDVSIEVTGAERAFLLLYPQDGGDLKISVARKIDPASYNSSDFFISRTIIEQVTQSATPVILSNSDEIFNSEEIPESIESYGIKSIVCVPVKLYDRLLGVLYLDSGLVAALFNQSKTELLEAITIQAAVSIENARLFRKLKVSEQNLLENRDNLQSTIKELRATKNELSVQKEQLSVTLRSIGDAVISLDSEGNVILMNDAALKLICCSINEVVNKHVDTVINIISDQTNEKINNLHSFFMSYKYSELQTSLYLKNGTHRNVSITVSPLDLINKNEKGCVIVLRDITEKIQLEKEMHRTIRLESMGIMAGGIAHDFNNLLGGIYGCIRLAQNGISDKNAVIRHLERGQQALKHASDLTKRLMTFTKGDAPVKESVEISSMIREILELSLSGSALKTTIQLSDNLHNALVDKGQFSQVLNNLIINARQACNEEGEITICAQNYACSENSTWPLKPGKYVSISIHDTGHGIPENIINKIFDPFFTTKIHGSGLGLASSFSILKNHNGHITVESPPGQGTTFRIFLPASKDFSVPVIVNKKLFLKKTAKILIMDDDYLILETAAEILSLNGFETHQAINDQIALEKFLDAVNQSKPFDIVILDLTIKGGEGGRRVLQRMLKIAPSISAIAISGYSEDPVMKDPQAYGFTGVIKKPATEDLFISMISAILSEKDV